MTVSWAFWTSLWIPLQLQNLDVWHRWPTLAELRLLAACTGWVAYPHVTSMTALWHQTRSDRIGQLTPQRSEAQLAEFLHSQSFYTCFLQFMKGHSPAMYFCHNDEWMRVTSSYMWPLVAFTSVKLELKACSFITRKFTLHGVCRKRLIKGVNLWSTDNMGLLVSHFRGQDDVLRQFMFPH